MKKTLVATLFLLTSCGSIQMEPIDLGLEVEIEEALDAAINNIITVFTTISALKNKLIKEKSTELPKPTA